MFAYKQRGWQSIGDWLGTGKIATQQRVYRSFEEAREFSRGLGLKSGKEWRSFCQGELIEKGVLPEDIPAAPNQTYKYRGWKSMGDWLGTGTIASYLKVFRSFDEARKFTRNLALKNQYEWNSFCQGKMLEKGTLPKDIPSNPYKTYKYKGWINWAN